MKDMIGYGWGNRAWHGAKAENVNELWKSNKLTSDRYNLFTHHNELLNTTHWDNHFSMLYSDKETIERVRKHCNLEGFYCNVWQNRDIHV